MTARLVLSDGANYARGLKGVDRFALRNKKSFVSSKLSIIGARLSLASDVHREHCESALMHETRRKFCTNPLS